MEISKINETRDLDSALCQIVDARGEYLFSIVIAGPTHPKARAFAESEGRSLAHQGKRLGNIQKAVDARIETNLTDSEVSLQRTVKGLMARTLDWQDITDDGNPIPYDAKVMQGWYETQNWLREQVSVFVGDPRNFLTSSSTTSSPTPSTSSN